MSDFNTERTVKALRKRSQCSACCRWIEPGQPAIRWAGVYEGDFSSTDYHPECRAAEIEFNSLIDYRYGDEWTSLSDIESDMIDWLAEAHPLAYAWRGVSPSATPHSPVSPEPNNPHTSR